MCTQTAADTCSQASSSSRYLTTKTNPLQLDAQQIQLNARSFLFSVLINACNFKAYPRPCLVTLYLFL